jgi:hypothetical protein
MGQHIEAFGAVTTSAALSELMGDPERLAAAGVAKPADQVGLPSPASSATATPQSGFGFGVYCVMCSSGHILSDQFPSDLGGQAMLRFCTSGLLGTALPDEEALALVPLPELRRACLTRQDPEVGPVCSAPCVAGTGNPVPIASRCSARCGTLSSDNPGHPARRSSPPPTGCGRGWRPRPRSRRWRRPAAARRRRR